MMNELLLILSLVLIFGGVFAAYRFFGAQGLYAMNIFSTLLANIEVMLVVRAFGMEMTLGNVLFASTFLITDILSENHGKKAANLAVAMGVGASVLFLAVSQLWLVFSPAESDWAMPYFQALFRNSPRIVGASLAVYALTQWGDVWLYHKLWDFTKRISGDSRKALWLRNNAATLISQLFNTVLYNLLAFGGVFSAGTLISVMAGSYLIFIFTSLLDTPVVYLCRRFHDRAENP